MAEKSVAPVAPTTQQSATTQEPQTQDLGSNADAVDAAGLRQAEMRSRLQGERGGILGAGSFSDIAAVIDGSQSDKKGEAAIKLRNTDRGVERARAHFQKNGMAKEEKAFIDDRYAGALSDQKQGIAEKGKERAPALAQILAKPDPELGEANYSDLQWNAVFGANSATTLKQELVDADAMQATVEVVKTKGGLAKLIGLGNLWGSMDEKLKELWTQAYGDEGAAKRAWIAQTKGGKTPAIVPAQMGGVDPEEFKRFSSLAAAFSKPTNGCMGMGEDYQFTSIKEACDALGLQPGWYQDGAFVLSVSGAAVEEAVEHAKDAGGGVGKATVFTSLMFSEFNYIAEDRATNETESGDVGVNPNAKQNSGNRSAGGKTEVVVTNFQAADLFAQSPVFLG